MLHDTEVALAGSAALLNTAPTDSEPNREELATRAELDAFVRVWGWTGSRTRDRRELDDVRALRPRLRAIWTADVDTAVDLVNGLLREMEALPQLVKHDDWGLSPPRDVVRGSTGAQDGGRGSDGVRGRDQDGGDRPARSLRGLGM